MSSSGNPLASLIVKFEAQSDDFSKSIDDISSQLGDLGDKALAFGSKIAEGLSFTAVTTEVFNAGEAFEDAFAKIERATGDVGAPLQGLEDSFKATFGNVTQGADDVASSLALLSQRTGATGDDLNALLDINSKLAQVLDQQLRPTVDATQKVFTAFNTAVEDQPAALDALLAIVQKSGASFNGLVGNLTSVGPTLRAMGLDLTDSAALLANFETHGENVSRVATTLNQTLVQLAKEGFVDPKAALGDFLQEIIDAKDPTEALQTAAENLRGKGLVPLVDALQNGVGNLSALRDAAANSKGTIDNTAASSELLGEKFTKLKGATTELLAPIGTDLVVALAKLVDTGTLVVKFIDSIVQKADDLDNKFGTDTEHITGFAELFDMMAVAITEKAIPAFKDLADEADENKFVDGTMATGLKTLSDMFPNLGKGAGDARDQFEELDKELKTAEKNLSDVEQSVRQGVGTDEDAAAARLKVVAALQALHPEYTNIFADTNEWNGVMAASNSLIGDQTAALFSSLPAIDSSTALLEEQAISLQTRAALWPLDIQGIKDQADALTASIPVLDLNYVGMKTLDGIIKDSQKDLKDQEQTIIQQTQAFGPLHDAHILGISDISTLKKNADDADAALARMTGAVDDQGNSVFSLTQKMQAQITDLKDQIAYQDALGNDTTDLRIKLDQVTESLSRQSLGFSDLYKSLNQITLSDVTKGMDDLIFDIGKVGDDFSKLGEDLVTTVTNRILKDAIQPLLDSLDKVIAKAVSAGEQVLGIGVSSSGAPISIPSFPSGVTDIGAAGSGAVGDIVNGGDTLAGVGTPVSTLSNLTDNVGSAAGSSASSAGSTASSLLGSITGIAGAVGSIATAIGTFVEGSAENSKLFDIETTTAETAIDVHGIRGDAFPFLESQVWVLHGDLVGIWSDVGTIMNDIAGVVSGFSALANLPAQLVDALSTGLAGILADLDAIKNEETFWFPALHNDLVNLDGRLSLLAPVQAGSAANPIQIQGNVFLDGNEMWSSFITWLQTSGTKIPQTS